MSLSFRIGALEACAAYWFAIGDSAESRRNLRVRIIQAHCALEQANARAANLSEKYVLSLSRKYPNETNCHIAPEFCCYGVCLGR